MKGAKLAQKAVEFKVIPLKDIIDKTPRKTPERILTARAIRGKIEKLFNGGDTETTFSELKEVIQSGFYIKETKNEFEEAFAKSEDPKIKKLFLALIIELELNGFETHINQKEVLRCMNEDKELRYMAVWYKKLVRDREGHDAVVSHTQMFEKIYQMVFDDDIIIREIAFAYLRILKESTNMHNKDLLSLKIEGETRSSAQFEELKK